jgi:hypothetical protein
MSKNTITKAYIRDLIVSYNQASVRCKEIEREAMKAREASDDLKSHLVELHRAGVDLSHGKLKAIVVETPRAAYTVAESVRVTVSIQGV